MLPLCTNRPSTPPLEFGPAMYDWKVGSLGEVGSNHIRTPCTFPSGSLNETYQYEPGGCGFSPGSVLSWKRSLRLPSLEYGCDSWRELRSVPGVPVRLSPVESVRIVSPGALHWSTGVTVVTCSPASLLAGPSPREFTATTL